jgi:hypothetical protein
LTDNEEGFCTSRLQGNDYVANIAYFSSADFGSYLSGMAYTANQSRNYTAKEIIDNAPNGATHVLFSTHRNFAPLQITMFEDINNQPKLTYILIASQSDFNILGFVRPAGTIEESNNYIRTDYIDIKGRNFNYIKAHTSPKRVTVSPIVFFDVDKNYIGGYNPVSVEEGDYIMQVPSDAAYVMSSSFMTSNDPLEVYGVYEEN